MIDQSTAAEIRQAINEVPGLAEVVAQQVAQGPEIIGKPTKKVKVNVATNPKYVVQSRKIKSQYGGLRYREARFRRTGAARFSPIGKREAKKRRGYRAPNRRPEPPPPERFEEVNYQEEAGPPPPSYTYVEGID